MKKITFIGAGQPTADVVFNRHKAPLSGLTEQGRQQIEGAALYIGPIKHLIATYEPDVCESARIIMGTRFPTHTTFIRELGMEVGRPCEWTDTAARELWLAMQRLCSPSASVAVIIRADLIPGIVRALCKSYQCSREILDRLDRSRINFGYSFTIAFGN